MGLTKEKKYKKRAWKKERNIAQRPFKGLAVATGVVGSITLIFASMYGIISNAFSILMGDKDYRLENYDETAVRYKSDFKDNKERIEYEKALVEKIEKEGAVLLKNDNALPVSTSATNKAKISCFSTSSVDFLYGGTGSAGFDTKTAPTLKSSLEAANFEVNEKLWNFYNSSTIKPFRRKGTSMITGEKSKIGEAPWSLYDKETLDSVSGSEVALVTLSRTGGEGGDLEFTKSNYLALDENEKDMMKGIKRLKDEGKVKKVVVLLNSSNAIQLDFLKSEEYSVDAILWVGGVGKTGLNAIGKLLNGEYNPSGSLPDTFLYDNYKNPAMANFAPCIYEGSKENGLNNNQKYYSVYQEGIYVGYKYFETRYVDLVETRNNVGDYRYEEEVAYPFGYGLSYTTFDYSNVSMNYNATTDKFDLSLTVKNTGDVSGRKAVQIYASLPYIQGGVEKSAVQLVGFTKTKLLAPNEEESCLISVERRDLASYDADNAMTYVMDIGNYYLTVANNAHDAANKIISKRNDLENTTMASSKITKFKGDEEMNKDEVMYFNLDDKDVSSYSKSKNGTVITNQFDDADLAKYEGSPKKDIKYLSRSNWTGTYPTEAVKLSLTEKLLEDLKHQKHVISSDGEMPLIGQKNNITAYEMIGVDLNDEKWNAFISQMTIDEMVNFIGNAFHLTHAIETLNLVGSRQENGPQGYNGYFGITNFEPMAITSCDILAATMDVELVEDVGRCIGNDCLGDGISCLYGPGNNIHRTPYGGRNFEYYSEDGFLSGVIGNYENKGIISKGVRVEIKHFVLNDCEEERQGLGVWLNEQSFREIYLKAFQQVMEENKDAGVMTSYSRIGATWNSKCESLLKNVLRGEWGSTGFIISDNVNTDYQNGIDGVIAGTTLFDSMTASTKKHLEKAKNDPVVVKAMQEASKYNIYNIVNSAAMNGVGANTKVVMQPYTILVISTVVTILLLSGFVTCLTFSIIKGKKYKKEHPIDWK